MFPMALALLCTLASAMSNMSVRVLQPDLASSLTLRELQPGVLVGGLTLRELQPGVYLQMYIPPAGSLSPIWGMLYGAANPTLYKLCIYLESTAQGQSLYVGPKPAEEDDSFAPILPDGSFSFVNWWANGLLDPVTPFVHGYAFPAALGNCMFVPLLHPLTLACFAPALTLLPTPLPPLPVLCWARPSSPPR